MSRDLPVDGSLKRNILSVKEQIMKYLYGPVPSRRLGLSLGIDCVPMKTCSLSCIYCQLGRTYATTLDRSEYVLVSEILEEIKSWLKKEISADWITFSGSGEPTLNSGIGRLIQSIKSLTQIPVCVITNGTLLWLPEVRHDIIDADAVMPSLDSAREETFQTICRPHPDLHVETIIKGLIKFRQEYSGKMWLEILFVDGVNDSQDDIKALQTAIERINPDAIYLNTVARPPAERGVKPLSPERMNEIKKFFGDKVEVIASFKGEPIETHSADLDEIRNYLKRRPGSSEDISVALSINPHETLKLLTRLKDIGEVTSRTFSGNTFWEYKGNG